MTNPIQKMTAEGIAKAIQYQLDCAYGLDHLTDMEYIDLLDKIAAECSKRKENTIWMLVNDYPSFDHPKPFDKHQATHLG